MTDLSVHSPAHRLDVLHDERRVEILARYRRDCELARARAETDLRDLREWRRHTARLCGAQQAPDTGQEQRAA